VLFIFSDGYLTTVVSSNVQFVL